MPRLSIAKSITPLKQASRKAGALLGAGLLAAAFCTSGSAWGQQTTPVRLRLDWTALGYHAPFFYGVTSGIYEKAGIKLTIEDGKGSAAVAQLAASGNDDFGFSDATTVAQLAAKGLPGKVVMGILRGTTLAMFYAPGRGISSAADMKGRKIAVCPGDAISVYIPAYLKSLGLGQGDMQQLSVDCTLKYTVVAQGRADAVMTYATAGKPLLQKVGIAGAGSFLAGKDFYLPGHGIVASNKLIREKPELIRKFVEATAQAWAEAAEHPDAAVQAIIQERPLLKGDGAALKETFLTSLNFLEGPSSKGKPFGYQSEQDWDKALRILEQYAGVSPSLKASDVMTNAFIPGK